MFKRLCMHDRAAHGMGRASAWLGWAQALADRFSRPDKQPVGSQMLFALARSPLIHVHHYWRPLSLTLFPQIRLALRGGAVPAKEHCPGSGTCVATPLWPRLFRHERVAADQATVTMFSAPVTGHNDEPLGTLTNPFFQRRLAPPRAVGEIGAGLLPIGDTSTARGSIILPEMLRLTRRIVEERQRVEERLPTRMVIKRESGALQGQRQDSAAASDGRDQGHLPRRTWGSRGAGHAAPGPPSNLEQLTENVIQRINDRMTAYRERMGKLF